MFDVDTITRDVVHRVIAHYHQVGQSLYSNGSSDSPDTPFQSSPLADNVKLLIRVANDEFDRTTAGDETVGEIMETLQDITDLLFARAEGSYLYAIPNSFWTQSDIGQVMGRVQAWLRRDDLITYTEAAQILFSELAEENIQAARMRIKRLVERGKLMSYVALDETNPTQRMRVSRLTIEALLAAESVKS